MHIPSNRSYAVRRGSTRMHQRLTCSPIHLAPYRIQCVCSHHSLGITLNVLSMTVNRCVKRLWVDKKSPEKRNTDSVFFFFKDGFLKTLFPQDFLQYHQKIDEK